MNELRSQAAGLERAADRELRASRAVEWLRAFADAWQDAGVPEAKAELIHAIYERLVVAGRRFVEVRLTPAGAKRHLLDLRARSGVTTEQLIYRRRAEGWLVVSALEPDCVTPPHRRQWVTHVADSRAPTRAAQLSGRS